MTHCGTDLIATVVLSAALTLWFNRELGESTTIDIEARICNWIIFSNSSLLINQLELYIQ